MITHTLLTFEKLNSTSDFLKENQAYFPNMTLIRTHHQIFGRGQYDRTWESEPNQNLLFSILLKDINVSKTFEIKKWIVTSMTVFLNSKGLEVRFREPNDLYIDDQKLSGILIETKSSSNVFDYVVIGIGLNVNQVDFETKHATSMRKKNNTFYDIEDVFQELIEYLLKHYESMIL